jgi:hypothetical protein
MELHELDRCIYSKEKCKEIEKELAVRKQVLPNLLKNGSYVVSGVWDELSGSQVTMTLV